MKKIAIFSDIHGNIQALTSILEDINNSSFDEVICLGDIIGIGPNPKECFDLIRNSNIKVIKGNHEVYQINKELAKSHLSDGEKKHKEWITNQLSEDDINYIKDLPMELEELIDGKLFNFSHFFLNSEKDYYESLQILGSEKVFDVANIQESDYMFIGHSHDPFQIHNDNLVTCVGSSGCRKNNMTFYTILEVRHKNVRITKKEILFDRKTFEKEFKNNNFPDRERVSEIFFGIKLKEE